MRRNVDMKKGGDFKKYVQAMTSLAQKMNPERFKFCQCSDVKHLSVQTTCQICQCPIRRSFKTTMCKPRAKETSPRKQPEAEFRRILIPHLRRKNCTVMRIENSIGGRHNVGVADLIVFCETTKWGGMVELKSQEGVLSNEQKEFQRLCALCGIKYLVVRTLEETEKIYKEEKCLT